MTGRDDEEGRRDEGAQGTPTVPGRHGPPGGLHTHGSGIGIGSTGDTGYFRDFRQAGLTPPMYPPVTPNKSVAREERDRSMDHPVVEAWAEPVAYAQSYPLFLAEVIDGPHARTISERIVAGRVIGWEWDSGEEPLAHLIGIDHLDGMATRGAFRRRLAPGRMEAPVFLADSLAEAVQLAQAWGERTSRRGSAVEGR